MTIPSTLGSALEASNQGMAKARRAADEAAGRIANFGQTTAVPTESPVNAGGLTGDILQVSQAAIAMKANATVARIVDQTMSEVMGLGAKIDRTV